MLIYLARLSMSGLMVSVFLFLVDAVLEDFSSRNIPEGGFYKASIIILLERIIIVISLFF
jgi:hypothetical protein